MKTLITIAFLLCSIGVSAQNKCDPCKLSDKYRKSLYLNWNNEAKHDSLYYNFCKYNLECQRILIAKGDVAIKKLEKSINKLNKSHYQLR